MIPKVSVVIPSLNEARYIGRCLDSLVACAYPKDSLRVFVCDGKSTDQTPTIVHAFSAEHSWIRLLTNENRTTPYALNLGIQHSDREDIVIILGAHSEIYPDYIYECIKAFERDPQIGCAGGIIENINENESSEVIALAMSSSFGVGNAYFRTGAKEGYVDTVAFGAYRKEVFERIGLFDTELTRNQDDEFNYRLLRNGFKIWLSLSVRSKYYVRASFSKLYRQYFQYGYWKVFVNKKHGTITTLRQLVPFFFVCFLFFGALLSLVHPLLLNTFAAILLLYIAGALFSAISRTTHPRKVLQVMFTFFILHLSYGSGYAEGILNFYVLGKGPRTKASATSR